MVIHKDLAVEKTLSIKNEIEPDLLYVGKGRLKINFTADAGLPTARSTSLVLKESNYFDHLKKEERSSDSNEPLKDFVISDIVAVKPTVVYILPLHLYLQFANDEA